eukprot:CAMPEP_0119054874 /NCGR_PEP_ID=MMETSP1177-20130426/75366_1 /TAXON_ID=2985 /ORGANISM="Ochromonas sp, Strain CCMP1899" /LENGTH=266 /DNA_ID=CAMNT_0007035271 /DNA_START=703 /DNA_END=1504 /DNA_ORIENTATION=+
MTKAEDKKELKKEVALLSELTKKSQLEEEKERKAIDMKALSQGRRRFNPDLVPVPLMTLCRVEEGSPDMFILHEMGDKLKSGDIVRIGDAESRDYIIGYRSEELKAMHPRYFPLKPKYSLSSEEDSIQTYRGNFSYDSHVLESGLLKKPKDLGYEFDYDKTLPIAEDCIIAIEGDDDYGGGAVDIPTQIDISEKSVGNGSDGGDLSVALSTNLSEDYDEVMKESNEQVNCGSGSVSLRKMMLDPGGAYNMMKARLDILRDILIQMK